MGVDHGSNTFTFSSSRRRLLAAAAALALPGCAHSAAANAKSVLFVCQFGTVKSAVARELFRRRAAAIGLRVNAASRGITPEDHLSPQLSARLRDDGVDPAREPVRQIDIATLHQADIVVAFDPLPPSLPRPDARDWSAMPSMNADYDNARAFLDRHIEDLLTEIGGRPSA